MNAPYWIVPSLLCIVDIVFDIRVLNNFGAECNEFYEGHPVCILSLQLYKWKQLIKKMHYARAVAGKLLQLSYKAAPRVLEEEDDLDGAGATTWQNALS